MMPLRLSTMRQVSRHVLTSSMKKPVIHSQTASLLRMRLPAASFHATALRPASAHNPWEAPQPHPVLEKIQANPHIMHQLIDFTRLLQTKGIDMNGRQPSFTEMMKIMADPEVKESVRKLAQDMQAAGIQLDMQTVMELQNSLMKAEDQNKEEKGDVVSKVKSFFKK